MRGNRAVSKRGLIKIMDKLGDAQNDWAGTAGGSEEEKKALKRWKQKSEIVTKISLEGMDRSTLNSLYLVVPFETSAERTIKEAIKKLEEGKECLKGN